MKKSYVIRARHFAALIHPFIANCVTVEDFEDAVDNFNVMYHRNVRLAHGQTRIALITSDYVLKIDYGTRRSLWGGCEEECRGYQMAFNDGYGYLFAQISRVMVNEKVYYIMPRIKHIDEEYNNYEDAYDKVNNEECDYLFKHFHDLHCRNYGWKDGHPVIVDYACLRE